MTPPLKKEKDKHYFKQQMKSSNLINDVKMVQRMKDPKNSVRVPYHLLPNNPERKARMKRSFEAIRKELIDQNDETIKHVHS